jgi:hypothetical protein
MGVAAADAKNRDVAWLWRPRDFDRVPHDAVEVPVRTAVKVPIRWIEGDLVRNGASRFVGSASIIRQSVPAHLTRPM